MSNRAPCARRSPCRRASRSSGPLLAVLFLVLLVLVMAGAGSGASAAPPPAVSFAAFALAGRAPAFPPLRSEVRGAGAESVVGGGGAESVVRGGGAEQNPAPGGEEAQTSGPSRRKTILLSALVPGLGQLLRGERTYGTALLAGEVASWTSFAIFRVQGNLREDRYIEYAERFAGVEDASGQDDDYYGFLARYDRSGEPGGPDSYNEIEVRQVARDELYPGDRAAQEAYIREHSIEGALAWDWESEARRRQYAAIRIASENAFHRSEYAVGAMVAGRIFSIMHAIWFTAEPEETGADEEARKGTYQPFLDTDVRRGESRLGLRYRF